MERIADLERRIRRTDLHAAIVALVGADEDLPITEGQRASLRAMAYINARRHIECALLERGTRP